jgi:hypothetical protein
MKKVLYTLFLMPVILASLNGWSQNCKQLPSQIPDFSSVCSQVNPNNLNLTLFNDGIYSEGEVFRFTNAVTLPCNINAYIKIEKIKKAKIVLFDNNAAGVAQRFQPQIAPDHAVLNGNREGYVQFSIEFRKNNPGNPDHLALVNLSAGLCFRHFDVDGHTNGTNGIFREFGYTTGQSAVYFNSPTNLIDGGTVVDGGYTWKKINGHLVEHTSVSSDPDVNYTAVYSAVNTIRFRMGYKFVKGTGGSSETIGFREYAAEFGCFEMLTAPISLPVKLISFNGSYHNQKAMLTWVTENEYNFQKFEVERSTNGINFSTVGVVLPYGEEGKKVNYEFPDNLSSVPGNVFYYRLKMVDRDEKFEYSGTFFLRRDAKATKGLIINPNPVANGVAVVKLSALVKAKIELRVIDVSGKVLFRQAHNVYEGNNMITVNLSQLKTGVYTLQSINGNDITSSKFSVIR